jgi:hypothetical protein
MSKLALVVLALGLNACAMLESAFEMTFGPGRIERLAFEARMPRLADLPAMDPLTQEQAPGFPTSLEAATLAHLRGALGLSGSCSTGLTLEAGETDVRITKEEQYLLSRCDAGGPCTEGCPAAWGGLLMESAVTVELIDAAKAEEVKKSLAQVDLSAIVQIRLRFHELTLFTVRDGAEVDALALADDFTMWVRNGDGSELFLLDKIGAEAVGPDTPQRFELDAESEFVKGLKQSLLDAQPVNLTLVARLAVPLDALYAFPIEASGIRIDVQPEFVVSVLQAAESKL